MNRKTKACTALIISAAAAASCALSAFAAGSGDVNADGSLGLSDAVELMQYLTCERNTLTDAAAADLDGNSHINACDLTLLKRALLNPGSQEQPTDDSYVTQITYGANSVTLKNASDQIVPAGSAKNVKVENGTYVTVTLPTTDGTTDFGDINLDGECSNGQLRVEVSEEAYPTGQVTLNFRGLTLSNSSDSPVYIAQIADECVITVKKDTVNTISDGNSYQNADQSTGAIYSLDDLKFKGKGKLVVNGNAGDGIVSKDDIKIWNGDITVTAADDCIRGKDSIRVGDPDNIDVENGFDGLILNLTSKSGDGLKSTNDTADSGKGYIKINGGTVNITAGDANASESHSDGIDAAQEVYINGGDINITTYKGNVYTSSSTGQQNPWGGGPGGGMGGSKKNQLPTGQTAKGIKASGIEDANGNYQSMGNIYINGGKITIDATDDCLHSAGNLYLNAGKLKLASADDAVHSDKELYVGGTEAGTDYTSLEVYVSACYEGIEGYKIYQNNGNIYIIAADDGYNAAGGADNSGNTNDPNPWGQGGFPGGMGGGSYGEIYLNGGIVSVNTSFSDADGFDSNGPVVFNGGYYFGNGGDSFDSGDGYSITYNGGFAFGGLGMGGGSGYDMSTQMVFTDSAGNVLATSMSGSRMTYAYGNNTVLAYAGAQVTDGVNISTLGQPAVYISGKASGGTAKQLSQSSGGRW